MGKKNEKPTKDLPVQDSDKVKGGTTTVRDHRTATIRPVVRDHRTEN